MSIDTLSLQEQLFDPSLLDGRVDSLDAKVSAVIPSYNRVRAVQWCIDSLESQKGVDIDEIVVVCDGLDEEYLSLKSRIDLKVIQTDKRMGSSILRNIGVEAARNELFFFSDDDCVFTEYAVWGMAYSYLALKDGHEHSIENDGRVGSMHIPVYNRALVPREIVPQGSIGLLDFASGRITGNFDCFPEEYLQEPKFINGNGLLEPFEIGHLKGVFLCERRNYLAVGGFPDHAKTNLLLHYGDEIHFTLRMLKAGFHPFFNPDPKCAVLHLKYGLPGRFQKDSVPQKYIPFLEESDGVKEGGWRVKTDEWYYSKIMGFYVLLACYDVLAAFRWKERCRNEFVEQNAQGFGASLGKFIQDKSERLRILDNAIADGDDALLTHYQIRLS